MLTRRESRAVTLQTLFILDFKKSDDFKKYYEYTLSDFFDSKEDDGKIIERIKKDEYSFNLVKDILEKKDVLDEIIKKAAPNWPIEKISLIDKNILRIGIYELLFNEEKIPAPVAIDEAILLSKSFNPSDSSHKFISGVMGSVLEASGIEGDDSRKWVKKEYEGKYGFLPFYKEENKIKVALVFDIFDKWTLAKGSAKGNFKNENEAVLEVAKRKLNIEGIVGKKIGGHSYSAGIINDKRIIKNIQYFLLEVKNKDEVKLNPKLQGLNKVKFFELNELKNIDTYEDVLPLFEKAGRILEKK